MKRLAFWILGIALVLGTAVPAARAQAPAASGFRTIASPAGYQFQTPSDWSQLPFAALPFRIDAEAYGPNQKGLAIGNLTLAPGVTASDLPGLATLYISALDKVSSESGGSDFNVFQRPDPVEIANADAAVTFSGVETSADGVPTVISMRLALRGQSLYFFKVSAPQDYYDSGPDFIATVNSFRLTPEPPATSSSLAAAPTFALSPEEAMIAILPYKLGTDDALPGYTVGAIVGVRTSVADATGAPFPSDRFNEFQNAGFIGGFSQLLRSAATKEAAGYFSVKLFSDATSAAAYATGASIAPVVPADYQYEPVTLGAVIGDASSGSHVTQTGPGQPSIDIYEIRWQQGQVAYSLNLAPQPLVQPQADAESLAATIDSIERARPALSLGAPTVTPPATEARRLLAALGLKVFPLDSSAEPAGYTSSTPYFVSAADFVATVTDPAAQLHLVDEQWKVLAGERQFFTNAQNSQLSLFGGATTSADAQSADAYAGYIPPDEGGWTYTRLEAPIRLGGSVYALRGSKTDADGNASEGIFLNWTHGAVVLSARMVGPAGTTSMDQVLAFAKQVEAQYQSTVPQSAPGPITSH